jgi:phage shock protein A
MTTTKKDLEVENANMKEQLADMTNRYNTLMEQATQLQEVARNRLVTLRLFEAFANEVLTSTRKLQNDIAEINATVAEAARNMEEEER